MTSPKNNGFRDFALPQAIQLAIEKLNFTTPTPIQTQSIPVALEGKDVLGTAQTGTGKTAAFALPLLAHLTKNQNAMAIVLLPTRELAAQVEKAVNDLGFGSSMRSALLIGGDSMGKQLSQLQRKPRIIIGTPGRVNDHLKRGTLKLNHADFLVLDETDRMLDMGFGIQIETIIAKMPETRQTLMFSATMPHEITRLAQRYLINPVRIAVGETHKTADNVELKVVDTEEGKKYEHLLRELGERQGSVIIFVKTKYGADRLAKRLRGDDHESDALHGDLRQHKRTKVTNAFRDQKYRILVATDVAARGLDIPHIEHVINYDLPQAPEDFIHRIGRTGRAGAKGHAVSFVAPSESRKWFAIERLLNPDAKARKSSSGSYAPRKSEGHRGDRDRKPFGKKPFNKGGFGKKRFERDGDEPRSFEKRSFEKKPFVNKPFEKEEGGERKPFNKERSFDRSERRDDGDKPRSFAKKPFERREDGERKPFGKKPFNKERSFDRSERREDGDKPRSFAKKPFDKERSFGNDNRRPFNKDDRRDDRRDEKRGDSRSENRFGKSDGNKKPFNKTGSGKPSFGKPSFGKPAFGKRRDEEGAGGKPRSFDKKRGSKGSFH